MNYSYNVQAVLQWNVKDENVFEAVTDRKPAYSAKLWFCGDENDTHFRLCGEHFKCGVGGLEETIVDIDVCILGIPEPLRDEVSFCGLTFQNPAIRPFSVFCGPGTV